MRVTVVLALVVGLFFSCSRDCTVKVGGRMENGDSIVSIWVEDSIYTFPVDENNFFSGTIRLKREGYATLLPYSLNLYLSPGEDLEIYVNALNVSGSLYFRGSLGGVNSYLKEQEVAVFFDKDYYTLDEKEFIRKMNTLIDEKIKLLLAKNFDDSFTRLEIERIRYSIAERMLYYPFYRKRMNPQDTYEPSQLFLNFLGAFPLNNDDLVGSKDYRSFVLNYVYFQGSRAYEPGMNHSDGIVDYVLSSVTNPKVKDFLLTEIVYRHIWENNGLDGAEYLLSVFRRECTSQEKVEHVEEMLARWQRLLPGRQAPAFSVSDRKGRNVRLKDFHGSYLYITVWATWCVPCKTELPYLDLLQRKYNGRNIHFLTVAVGEEGDRGKWKEYVDRHNYSGAHAFASTDNTFNSDYMIISVPRFILVAPDGTIVNSNAPRPSGQILQYFEALNI